jgi:hypothetical protein
MGRLAFGKGEELTCIQDIDVRGKDDEALCLAHKTSTFFVGAGVYVSDDGYVLRAKGRDIYYPVTAEELAEMQQEGSLPTPLPPYSISWFEYAFGYSLWIIVGGMVIVGLLRKALRARRQAEDASTPLSLGPPPLSTKADHWLHEQVQPLLRFGETVHHQAYTLDGGPPSSIVGAASATSTYVVLTSQRVLLFQARVGAFGPLLEVRGTEEIARSDVRGSAVDDANLFLYLADGSVRHFFVSPTSKLGNQRAFLRDVPKILAADSAPASAAEAAA